MKPREKHSDENVAFDHRMHPESRCWAKSLVCRLVYDAFPPCSGKYRGNETAAACNVNWDFLYDREVYGNDMGTFWKHLCPA